MKTEPLKLCWLDLGEGKVCERRAGHDGNHSPDPTIDFPVEARMNPIQLAQSFLMDIAAGMVTGDEMRRRARLLAVELEPHAYPNGPTMVFAEIEQKAVDALAGVWDCPHCDWPPSSNPNDVANRYCGHCHHFCESLLPG